MDEAQRKDTRKTAKRLIKKAKEHPGWYTKEDVLYAKQVKRRIKQEKLAKKHEAENQKGV